MFELFTALEDAMVLSVRSRDFGYLLTQFEESEELDALLATADEFYWEDATQVFRFGDVLVYLDEDMGEDE